MKKALALLLSGVLGLAGCSQAPAPAAEQQEAQPVVQEAEQSLLEQKEPSLYAEAADPAFTQWLQDYVKESCEADYTTMHMYFENPQNYGMDPSQAEITLGSYLPTEEDYELLDEMEKGLDGFDPEKLDKTQAQIWKQLKWEASLTREQYKEENLYQGCIWGTLSNPADTLMTYFSEYEIREEADIEPLVELIKAVPDYIDDAVAFSQGQADRSMLTMNYDYMMDKCADVLDAKDDSAVTANLMQEIDDLNLANGEEYKKEVKKALKKYFFPAFETIEKELTLLKPYAVPVQPVSAFEGGKDYYALVVESSTGSSNTPEEMQKRLETAIYGLVEEVNAIMDKNYTAYKKAMNYTTSFQSPKEIMDFLEGAYSSYFPQVAPFQYELDPLSAEQSNPNTVAYFLIPPIDNTQPYRIRYNKRDYGDDTTDLSFYQTMAHEGVPGHMYQSQYDHENYEYLVQYMLGSAGFTEGYATYVECQSLKFLDMDPDIMTIINDMHLLDDYYTALMDLDINNNNLSLKQVQDKYGELFGMDMSSTYELVCQAPGTFLSYYFGNLEISQLRNEAMLELGEGFDDVAFNNALLEAGSVNFDIVRENVRDYVFGAN